MIAFGLLEGIMNGFVGDIDAGNFPSLLGQEHRISALPHSDIKRGSLLQPFLCLYQQCVGVPVKAVSRIMNERLVPACPLFFVLIAGGQRGLAKAK